MAKKNKSEQPSVTPPTEDPKAKAAHEPSVREIIQGLRQDYRNGRLTLQQVEYGLAHRDVGVVGTIIEILGMSIADHNRSVNEQKRPIPPPPMDPGPGHVPTISPTPEPQTPNKDASSQMRPDLNEIRAESTGPIGVIKIVITPEGGVEVTMPDPAGRRDAGRRESDRNGNLLAIAQLIAGL